MSSHLALLVDTRLLAASTVAMHICCMHESIKCKTTCAVTARSPYLQAPQSYRLSKAKVNKDYIKVPMLCRFKRVFGMMQMASVQSSRSIMKS